jgi:peptide/nickel transport system ATP-binding protein
MIAMALVCRPALLVADEPTTALDVTIQAQILQLVQTLQAELKMAMLLITHDLGIVANMADEVVVMYHGKVVEIGRAGGHLPRCAPSVPEGADARGAALQHGPRASGSRRSASCRPRPITLFRRGRPHGDENVSTEPLLVARNLVKRFETRKTSLLGRKLAGEVRAVDDVSFHVGKGECPRPGGRVRLRQDHQPPRCCCARSPPDSGEIIFNDHDRPRDVLAMKARSCSALPAQGAVRVPGPVSSLNPRMTVNDILAEPLVIHGVGDKEERYARVKELMTLVGLDVRYLRRYPHQFLRRAAPAHRHRARARARPAAADLRRAGVGARRLGAGAGAQPAAGPEERAQLTYIFISHNLAVVHYLADRIAVMCAGRWSKSRL